MKRLCREPEGFLAISRWLSVAIPPDKYAPKALHPGRGARKRARRQSTYCERNHPLPAFVTWPFLAPFQGASFLGILTGGVASLDHRLIAKNPLGFTRDAPGRAARGQARRPSSHGLVIIRISELQFQQALACFGPCLPPALAGGPGRATSTQPASAGLPRSLAKAPGSPAEAGYSRGMGFFHQLKLVASNGLKPPEGG